MVEKLLSVCLYEADESDKSTLVRMASTYSMSVNTYYSVDMAIF